MLLEPITYPLYLYLYQYLYVSRVRAPNHDLDMTWVHADTPFRTMGPLSRFAERVIQPSFYVGVPINKHFASVVTVRYLVLARSSLLQVK